MGNDNFNYEVLKNPTYKAQYSFGGNTWIMSTEMPHIFHRVMQYLLLGIKWKKS